MKGNRWGIRSYSFERINKTKQQKKCALHKSVWRYMVEQSFGMHPQSARLYSSHLATAPHCSQTRHRTGRRSKTTQHNSPKWMWNNISYLGSNAESGLNLTTWEDLLMAVSHKAKTSRFCKIGPVALSLVLNTHLSIFVCLFSCNKELKIGILRGKKCKPFIYVNWKMIWIKQTCSSFIVANILHAWKLYAWRCLS